MKIKNTIIAVLLVFALGLSAFAVADTAASLKLGDTNGDGTINAGDALEVLQYSVGKIDKFSAESSLPNNPSPHTHSYVNYVCSTCSSVDKAHAYEYLMLWVKENGTTSGDYTKLEYQTDSDTYSLTYSTQSNSLLVDRSGFYDGTFSYGALYLDIFFYGCFFGDLEMYGYINASTFTANTAISYTKYIGESSYELAMTNLSRANACDLIEWLDWCLQTYDIGITIKDLGFEAY